jgi:predicted RNase H-like HicB family nuclease
MEELTIYITVAEDGDYLAATPLIPDEYVRGSTPDEAFEEMKRRTEKWIEHKGLKVAQMVFRFELEPGAAEAARAAHERGECQDLDSALAEIAGTTPDEWRKKVEAHKRARNS